MIKRKFVGPFVWSRGASVPVFCRKCGRMLKDGHKKHNHEICHNCLRDKR